MRLGPVWGFFEDIGHASGEPPRALLRFCLTCGVAAGLVIVLRLPGMAASVAAPLSVLGIAAIPSAVVLNVRLLGIVFDGEEFRCFVVAAADALTTLGLAALLVDALGAPSIVLFAIAAILVALLGLLFRLWATLFWNLDLRQRALERGTKAVSEALAGSSADVVVQVLAAEPDRVDLLLRRRGDDIPAAAPPLVVGTHRTPGQWYLLEKAQLEIGPAPAAAGYRAAATTTWIKSSEGSWWIGDDQTPRDHGSFKGEILVGATAIALLHLAVPALVPLVVGWISQIV